MACSLVLNHTVLPTWTRASWSARSYWSTKRGLFHLGVPLVLPSSLLSASLSFVVSFIQLWTSERSVCWICSLEPDPPQPLRGWTLARCCLLGGCNPVWFSYPVTAQGVACHWGSFGTCTLHLRDESGPFSGGWWWSQAYLLWTARSIEIRSVAQRKIVAFCVYCFL